MASDTIAAVDLKDLLPLGSLRCTVHILLEVAQVQPAQAHADERSQARFARIQLTCGGCRHVARTFFLMGSAVLQQFMFVHTQRAENPPCLILLEASGSRASECL